MRPIPKEAVDIVARFEGCELAAYLCPAGVWTIGYGSTKGVTSGMTITKAEARALLAEDLKDAARKLYTVIKRDILDCPASAGGLTGNQYAALISFAFNLGAGKGWTIWKRINARQFDQVPVELMKFVNAGGRKLKGLVRRRTAEVELWSTDEPGSLEEDLPSSETREMVTPPTPAEPRPPQKQATFLAAAGTAAAAVPTAAAQVKEALDPYAGVSEHLDRIITIATVILALTAVLTLIGVWLKSREHRS